MNYFSKKLNGNRKGFTLIELIVVIAIIGILVLLAGPKFLGYTKDAQHAKLVHNTKVYEDAATIYRIENGDWPRLTESDVYMTPTELNAYKDAYFDVTGQEVVLDETGHFYQLDWDKLAKYVKEPADSHMYILQNPVGKVFYMDSEPAEFMAYLSGSVGNFIAPEVAEAPEAISLYKSGPNIKVTAWDDSTQEGPENTTLMISGGGNQSVTVRLPVVYMEGTMLGDFDELSITVNGWSGTTGGLEVTADQQYIIIRGLSPDKVSTVLDITVTIEHEDSGQSLEYNFKLGRI